jgi:hypothetical protein
VQYQLLSFFKAQTVSKRNLVVTMGEILYKKMTMSAEINLVQTANRHNREANYVIAVLSVVIMLNFLDRRVISIVAEPIKQEMGGFLTNKSDS